MKQIVYNLSGIRAPLTGVGRYATELIKAVVKNRPETTAVRRGNLYSDESLIELLDSLESRRNDTKTKYSKRATDKLRKHIGHVPWSRSVYRTLDRMEFKQCSKPLVAKGSLAHDLNYSLNPDHCDISTVYDLSNITTPRTHPSHRIQYLNAYFKRLKTSQCHIVTISEAIKTELIEKFSINEARIDVTHLAANEAFSALSAANCKQVLDENGLAYKKYVLCVATLEPRKNLSTLLKAYEALDSETQREFPLVVAGTFGWKSSALDKRMHHLHKKGVIKRLGFVTQCDLPKLFSAASVFVYPSLYEGFGLPLLEAMQSGCACITSNSGALAEVSAGHTIEIDVLNADQIAHELNRLLQDSELNSYYEQMGQQRARDFSWTKTAKQTCAIYDSL